MPDPLTVRLYIKNVACVGLLTLWFLAIVGLIGWGVLDGQLYALGAGFLLFCAGIGAMWTEIDMTH